MVQFPVPAPLDPHTHIYYDGRTTAIFQACLKPELVNRPRNDSERDGDRQSAHGSYDPCLLVTHYIIESKSNHEYRHEQHATADYWGVIQETHACRAAKPQHKQEHMQVMVLTGQEC
jgi:hypothetical protein